MFGNKKELSVEIYTSNSLCAEKTLAFIHFIAICLNDNSIASFIGSVEKNSHAITEITFHEFRTSECKTLFQLN